MSTKAALFAALGEPDSIQVLGKDAYLSWSCSDGMIQVVCNAIAFNAVGQIIGAVNSF